MTPVTTSSLRTRCLALVLATSIATPATLAFQPSVAYAQGKKLRDQLPPDAQKHWDIALDLYARQKWDGARTSFNAAYEASKNPRVLFNVAVCEKNLGRYARAIEVFKRELAEGQSTLSATEQEEIRTQIAGLSRYVADLTIEVNVQGAEIFVDDERVGISPLPGPVSVQIGQRSVRAVKAGYVEARESVEANGGAAAKVSLKLSSSVPMSLVSVAVIGPPVATVKVDGKEVGQATRDVPYKGQVAISNEPHQFSAEAPGFVPATQSAVVRDSEPLNLTLQLAQDQAMGKLIVIAQPEGATIEIDGKVVGATRWEGPVEAKTHQIVVRKQGRYPWTYDVEVPKGGERTVTATLNEDRNTSFVPWLIGTVLVIGASSAAIYFISRPKDEEPVRGTLAPFAFGTQGVRF